MKVWNASQKWSFYVEAFITSSTNRTDKCTHMQTVATLWQLHLHVEVTWTDYVDSRHHKSCGLSVRNCTLLCKTFVVPCVYFCTEVVRRDSRVAVLLLTCNRTENFNRTITQLIRFVFSRLRAICRNRFVFCTSSMGLPPQGSWRPLTPLEALAGVWVSFMQKPWCNSDVHFPVV